MLYSLQDVKDLIAKNEKCEVGDIEIYNTKNITFDHPLGEAKVIANENFLFQVTPLPF